MHVRSLLSISLAAPLAAILACGAAAQAPAPSPQTTINVYPPGTQPPAGTQAPTTAIPTAPAAIPAGPRQTTGTVPGAFNQGETRVRVEVLSLTRESGTLMLRLRAANEGGVNANSVAMHVALSDAYIVDPTSQRRAGVMRGPSGELVTDMAASGVPAGRERELFAQFPEPPPNVTSVNLYLKGFSPIMGVPIT